MTFMRKIIDILNMDNWNENSRENTGKNNSDFSNEYNEYYKRIYDEKENNINISYNDVTKYDKKPFDLNKEFITDGNFTVIELDGENLKIAYETLNFINNIIIPYKNYYSVSLPNQITLEYLYSRKLPHSHLRLRPYTYSMSDNEFPILLWISYSGYYGNEYLYQIYFDKDGEIGYCDLQIFNYTIQIRKDENGLYVRKISVTLKKPPYGTKTLFIKKKNTNKKNENKIKNKKMSKNEIEMFMVECNAKIAHDEEMEQYKVKEMENK